MVIIHISNFAKAQNRQKILLNEVPHQICFARAQKSVLF